MEVKNKFLPSSLQTYQHFRYVFMSIVLNYICVVIERKLAKKKHLRVLYTSLPGDIYKTMYRMSIIFFSESIEHQI